MRARPILPGSFYMITRRCTQRQFLLRPGEKTNNAFSYCLGEAAQRFGIEVILPSVMSNHHHTVVFDRHGNINEFVQHLHKMFAKCQNASLGRWENLWAAEPVCKVKLVEPKAVHAKLVYAAINPVKDFLVDTVAHWPGVNGLCPLLNDRPLRAHRPAHFFRDDGPMPAEVTLHLVIPPELGEPAEVRRLLRERVAKVETHFKKLRARTGRRVLGRTPCSDSPVVTSLGQQTAFCCPTLDEQPRNDPPPHVGTAEDRPDSSYFAGGSRGTAAASQAIESSVVIG